MVKLKAILFDMDGLLIDSEPLWRKAEIAIFKSVSIELSDADCTKTAGLRIDEVVDYWYQKYPWQESEGFSIKDIEKKIVSELIQLISLEGEPMPGVKEILNFFEKLKIPMAIASSSYYNIINAVINKLNINQYFKIIHSAEEEEYGKPHPAIFLTAAKKMGVKNSECLVFEDSFHGIIAGLAAKMKVVAIPDKIYYNKAKFDIATLKIKSLSEFNEHYLTQLTLT